MAGLQQRQVTAAAPNRPSRASEEFRITSQSLTLAGVLLAAAKAFKFDLASVHGAASVVGAACITELAKVVTTTEAETGTVFSTEEHVQQFCACLKTLVDRWPPEWASRSAGGAD
jgi:hypothetical protein